MANVETRTVTLAPGAGACEAKPAGEGPFPGVVTYPAPHAFFNDTRPDVYRAQFAKDAWGKVLDLFRRTLEA